jgi:4'-phosphopantetheinyl transferase
MLFINDHIAELSEEQTERLISSLPEWRREQALRYKFLQGRRECAVAYVELLRGLRQQFGIYEKPVFSYNEHGKPYISQHPQVHFSLSHCKEAVGCFLSNRPCGLDIERIRTAKPDLVRHTMSPQESEGVFTSPFPDIVFTRLWTQKEAVLKLKGTGLVDDLHSVLKPDNLKDIEIQTTENPYMGYIFTIAKQL